MYYLQTFVNNEHLTRGDSLKYLTFKNISRAFPIDLSIYLLYIHLSIHLSSFLFFISLFLYIFFFLYLEAALEAFLELFLELEQEASLDKVLMLWR